jgi:HlyD family secretion protein
MSTVRAPVAVFSFRRSFPSVVLVLFAAIAGLSAMWLWQRSFTAESLDTPAVPPDGVSDRVAVHSLGRLEPASRILELAPESGNEGATIRELLVREGQDVVAGATLAILDNQTRREASVREARAALNAAQARLAQVRAGARAGDLAAQQAAVSLTEQQAMVARRELARAKELHERKALTIEELDTKQWELDRILIEQQRAAGLLASLREIRDTDVEVAAAEVARAEALLAFAETQLSSATLRAPVDGRILRIHNRPGERLSTDGVIELGDVRQMQAVAEVFEADVSLIQEGFKADVLVDGSGDVLQGTVVEIGQIVARKVVLTNDPVSDTDARVVEVRVNLDAESSARVARLSNSRVEVTIHLTPQ